MWLDGAPQGSQCLCPPSAVLSVLSFPVSGLVFLRSLWVIDGYVSVCVRKPESACFCSLCVTSLVSLGLSVVSV